MRETTEPRPSPAVRRSSTSRTGCLGAPSLSCCQPTPLDPAQSALWQAGRGCLNGRDHPPGQPVRQIRLPTDHRPAADRRLAGKCQAGPTHLAADGPLVTLCGHSAYSARCRVNNRRNRRKTFPGPCSDEPSAKVSRHGRLIPKDFPVCFARV